MNSIIQLPKGRHFGGKLFPFSNKTEKNQENKHLKAYLRGDENYIAGYETVGDVRVPIRKKVIVIWN